MREIYLDNSATTRALPEVAEAVSRAMLEDYGNPSSMHMKGFSAENLVRKSREQIAQTLHVSEKEILFTSGGTESNNQALLGVMQAMKRSGNHMITTAIEHPSIGRTADWLESQGFSVTRLPVDRTGLISPEELEQAIRPETVLVSVMMVNNEIGAVEPIEEIGKILSRQNRKILFHVDAVQAYGKLPIRPHTMGVDLMSVSGHKIHGPKGCGFLYIRDGVKLPPLMYGGGQQKNLRSGTENVPGIVGLGVAADYMYRNQEKHRQEMIRLRDRLTEGLKQLPDVTSNGPEGSARAPQIVSASFAGVRSEVLLHSLEEAGICVSAGSACASNGKKHPSETLTAIHMDRQLLDSTIRFSLGIYNTEEEIDETLQVLGKVLPVLRRFVRK